MGDIGVVDPAVASVHPASESISVLVTGFGPFKSNTVNASYLIATSLPSSISLSRGKSTTVDGRGVSVPQDISVYVHPLPIPVSYASVRTQLPSILNDFAQKHNGERPDLIVHMGIAQTRQYYSVETRAHRDYYRITDVDGRVGYDDGEKLWRVKGLPSVLYPLPKVDRVTSKTETGSTVSLTEDRGNLKMSPYPPNEHFLQVWQSYAPAATDLRLSQDAGRYLCEFIFYSSLAQAHEEGRDQSVLFFHVPSLTDDASLDLGNKIAVALIKAMVTCWIGEA